MESRTMIQLGPLELESTTVELPVGVKSGRIERGRTATPATRTVRMQIRLETTDPVYQQLIELSRNKYIVALPLYSGYKHIDGLYRIKSLREEPINWRWQDITLVIEAVGHHFHKSQQNMIRKDDWNIIYSEDFSSWSTPLLNQESWGDVTTIEIDTGTTGSATDFIRRAQVSVNYDTSYPTAIVGSKVGKLASAESVKAVLFGFDDWRNYDYSAWVQTASSSKHGIMWRVETGNIRGCEDDFTTDYSGNKGRGRHYELLVDPTNNRYIIEYHSSWETTEDQIDEIYSESHDALDTDTWYFLGVITVGKYHFCFVNGQLITYFKDDRCKGGRVGVILRESGSYPLYFDNIQVREIPSNLLVLDESYSEPQDELVKTRETLYGQIAYSEEPQITYKSDAGGARCILHLRFDQKYGSKVFDLSPYNHDALIKQGVWKDGFMRFTAGSDGLVIPYTSDLGNDDEGTVIIRFRMNGTVTSTADSIIRRGTTDWAIWMSTTNNDNLHSAAEEPGSAAAIVGPYTSYYPLRPDNEWRTLVVRWKDSIDRWEMYIDGLACGADYSNNQSGYGTSTTTDMIIGRANVDIESVIIYNQWMEEPSIPGAISSKILDVDTHHEDEVFDARFNEEIGYVEDMWKNTGQISHHH
jgi:hypothetical protein